jgi:hypothetical protein
VRPPHPPAGRNGLCALSVHNPSAGEGPSRVPMKCIGIAVHPLPPRGRGHGSHLGGEADIHHQISREAI